MSANDDYLNKYDIDYWQMSLLKRMMMSWRLRFPHGSDDLESLKYTSINMMF